MAQYYNLAIRWNNKKYSIPKIIEAGCISVHDCPRHLCPDKWVAIVAKGSNRIQLMFKVSSIKGPQPVILADGKNCKDGYVIRAERRSIQQPKQSTPPLKNYLPVIGAFGYFNKVTMEPVVVGDQQRAPHILPSKIRISGIDFELYVPGYPGMPHGDEEARLVKRYADWMGPNVRFGIKGIKGPKLFVDLFDLTHWQLLEAKIDISRETIRMAIGQLYDYKRYYKRPPSLAILLPSRPSTDCLDLLTQNHISVIWEKSIGRFTIKKWQN